MAFGRILNIFAGPNVYGACVDSPSLVKSGEMLQLVGKDPENGIEPLHAEAEIHRSNKMDRNTATIRIMNLREEVRKWLESTGNIVRVDIGYDDEGSGTVFLGQIHKAGSELIDASWVTELRCYHFRAKGMDFETLLVSISRDPGTNMQEVLKDIGLALNVPVLGADVSNIILDGGFVHTGTMKQALGQVQKHLMHEGYGMFYDLAELYVYEACNPITDLQAVTLDKESGLLSAKWVLNEKRDWRKDVQTKRTLERRRTAYDKAKSPDGRTRAAQALTVAEFNRAEARRHRVEITSLANHITRPNCPILIKHSAITGVDNPQNKYMLFVVDDVSLKVANFGNDFNMKIIASRDPSKGAGA